MIFPRLIARLLILILASYQIGLSAKDVNGGVSFGTSTRVVFNAEESKISFPISNLTSRAHVFQGLILNEDLKSFSKDFIVNPEVLHLPSGDTKKAQIIRLGGNFPSDRETLLYLQGHFLPNEVSQNKQNTLNISYAIQMKMFFRPSKLKAGFDAIDDVADELEFKVRAKRLYVKNLSPYYLTVNTIHLGNKRILIPDETSMISPFGETSYGLPDKYENKITWTLINDGGYATKPITRDL